MKNEFIKNLKDTVDFWIENNSGINNEIRENAKKIFSEFNRQGVKIKVISGDNPLTVSKVAQEAHIKNAHKYIDATTLDSYSEIKKAVTKYTIFFT